MISFARRPQHISRRGSAWSVLELAEGMSIWPVSLLCSPNAHTGMGEEGYAHRSCAPGVRTQDQSNCEIKGGAPSCAHVWTHPGCSLARTSQLAGNNAQWRSFSPPWRGNERAWKEHLKARRP